MTGLLYICCSCFILFGSLVNSKIIRNCDDIDSHLALIEHRQTALQIKAVEDELRESLEASEAEALIEAVRLNPEDYVGDARTKVAELAELHLKHVEDIYENADNQDVAILVDALHCRVQELEQQLDEAVQTLDDTIQAETDALSTELKRKLDDAVQTLRDTNNQGRASLQTALIGKIDSAVTTLQATCSEGRKWIKVGVLNDLDNLFNQYPLLEYEYGTAYNLFQPMPVTINGWNKGIRVAQSVLYPQLDSGDALNYGTTVFVKGTDENSDKNKWYSYYYRQNDNGVIENRGWEKREVGHVEVYVRKM